MKRFLPFGLVLSLVAIPACAQQVPDTTFDTSIARPAWPNHGPRLLLDEAHHNFHTASGRYRVFADLARHDGWTVTPSTQRFTAQTLKAGDLLVIANALGHEDMDDPRAERPAFTDAESDAVRDWVRAGGALLLIADHAPMGAAAKALGARFGVDMRCAYTIDPEQSAGKNPGFVAYTAGHGLATEHPIVRGRDSTERVNRVVTFTGQSITGPEGSVQLLALSAKAIDLMVPYGRMDSVPDSLKQSAAGRAQGIALTFGKGRVVVLAEAAMMSAQLAGPGGTFKMGMNAPGSDDRQFAINVVRWLGGALQ